MSENEVKIRVDLLSDEVVTERRNKFGQMIKKERENLNISQTELAKRSGLHRNYISDVERGERNASFTSIYKISVGLNTTMSHLLR